MSEINTYSPTDVILTVIDHKLTGWESISISKTSPSFIAVPGIRGKHTRVENPDRSCTISFGLINTSKSNDFISAIHAADVTNGTAKLSVMLKDNSGNSVFSSNDAYILTYPDVMFSGGFEYRKWDIFCQTVSDYNVGGNSKPKTIFDSLFSSF